MRIGTWNLAGRWSDDHRALLGSLGCDVLLLTEVSEAVSLSGHHVHLGTSPMAPGRRWAAVATTAPAIAPLTDPHPASAAARIGSITFCSTVLPWRSCGSDPWGEGSHAERTARALSVLESWAPTDDLVWGGDWNHALSGREWAGSKGSRERIGSTLGRWGLTVPTADLPHRIAGLLTIDHVAVPRQWSILGTSRVVADRAGRRLSDHDAYVVEVRSVPRATD